MHRFAKRYARRGVRYLARDAAHNVVHNLADGGSSSLSCRRIERNIMGEPRQDVTRDMVGNTSRKRPRIMSRIISRIARLATCLSDAFGASSCVSPGESLHVTCCKIPCA